MACIGLDAYEKEISKEVTLSMDFTGRPVKSFIYVTPEGIDFDEDLEYWIDLCFAFNPMAKASPKRKKN